MPQNSVFFIVGSGLAGSVIANRLASSGKKVIIYEKREHTGGNVYDYVDEFGINVHKYGPHIFHTNSDRVYNFLSGFAKFDNYNLVCGSVIDGKCVRTSFDFSSIDTFFPEESNKIKLSIKNKYGNAKSATILELLDCDNDLIRKFAKFLYDKDYAPYTAKQWGIDINKIDPSIFSRVPVLFSYDSKYFDDKYQGIPSLGYTNLINNLLDDVNITIELNKDALGVLHFDENSLKVKGQDSNCIVVYTGMIDSLFEFKYGVLPYRSLRFEFKHENIDSFQQYPVVAYPAAKGYTRITEYKKLPIQNVTGTTYAEEYPITYNNSNNSIPYYPILTNESKEMYAKYYSLAKKYNNLVLCGRLAEFKYYNMDQVVERALEISDLLLAKENFYV